MKQLINWSMVFLLMVNVFSLTGQESKTYTLEALQAKQRKESGDKSIPETTDAQFEERIGKLSTQFPMKFNPLVKAHIKAYVERRRSSTETIIGRSSIYFPIFETALMRHNVPSDLKYLSIVESALNPAAISPAGAAGLWQFMKGTGLQYNLRITKEVDERNDPHMSSDAAARYLQDLYEIYGDWALSIAAYNCGPGRINSAIKKANSNDYWTISKYLPKETKNYVPAFIAVAYTLNYYHLHNIYPEFPEYDLQVTENVRIFHRMTFNEIAEASNTDVETVAFLNPSYKSKYVPASSAGYVVTLPMSKMTAFRESTPNSKSLHSNYASLSGQLQPSDAKGYLVSNEIIKQADEADAEEKVEYEQVKTVYSVKKGDNLGKIASQFDITIKELRSWNKLNGSLLYVNQKLVVYETKAVAKKEAVEFENTNKEVAYYIDGEPVYVKSPVANNGEEQPKAVAVANVTKSEPLTPAAAAVVDNRIVSHYVDGKPVYMQRVKAAPVNSAPLTPTDAKRINVPVVEKAAKESKTEITYAIKRGDSLWKIGNKYNVTVKELMEWNNIDRHMELRPGMKLKIMTTQR